MFVCISTTLFVYKCDDSTCDYHMILFYILYTLQITAGESPQATQTTTESSSGTTPAYIWAVVAVAIAAVIITAIVLVMVIVIVAGKKSASM